MDRLVETRHTTATDLRHIRVPGGQQQDGNSWLFLPQTSGGSIALPGQGDRQLHWHLQTHNVSTLSLAEVSLTAGQTGRGLQLEIHDQVFPAITSQVDNSARCLRICLVLASKAVAVLTLPLVATSAQGSSSILDRFGQGGAGDAGWHVVQLGPQLTAVGLPSALAIAGDHLCVAGSSGSTTCISMAVLASGEVQEMPADAHSAVINLDPSGLVAQVKRRIGLAGSVPAVAAVAVDIPQAQHSSLLVVHEDGSCYQWLVGQHRQGLYQHLTAGIQGKPPRPNRVCLCYPQPTSSSRAPAWDVLLVFDLGQPDRGAQSDIRVLPLRLQREQDQAANRLEALLQQPQALRLERPDASLVDAKLVGQQLLLLCNTTSRGSFVVSYAVKDWSYHGPCQLLQQKAADWGGHQEVWSAALAAFPDDIDPGSHVLSQLLVPGQLCGNTLRQALGYFGGQLGAAELAESSLSQVQACVTATVQLIQARNPAYSPARCWHMLFAKYCELWQQQHPIMGLWSSKGGWVGAVRAGGLLTVLRGVTPAEALGQESTPAVLRHVMEVAGMSDRSSNSGVIGGSADVAKVRGCLDTLGEVLGQPALSVMTQLVMAGVPVESGLLPAFVQLLLQGPPLQPQVPGQTGFVGDGSSAARQQRLLQWRQQRQAQLLAVHEKLSELPHALETLTGFVDLCVMAATQAAPQLQSPAPAAGSAPPLSMASFVSSVALHSLRATCTTLQKLLLLLSYISHMGSLGSAPLTAADHAAMAADLIAPLATALRSAAAALWLCKTPASAPVPGLLAGLRGSTGLPGPLPSLRAAGGQGGAADSPRGVHTLAKGSLAQPGAAGSGGAAGSAASWRYPLAAHLLPSFWQQQHLTAAGTTGAAVSQVADQLAVWLMLGAETADVSDAAGPNIIKAEAWHSITGRARNAEQGAGPGVFAKAERALRSAPGLAGRVVLVGYRLFMAREYAAMQRLVQLVGGDSPSEAGLQYILGLSIACSVQGRTAPTGQQLESAVGHLFRAAAGLCSSEAGPLRLVLQLLRQQQHHQHQQHNDQMAGSDAGADVDMDANGQLSSMNGYTVDAADGCQQDSMQLDKQQQFSSLEVQRRQQQQDEAVLRLQFDQAVMMLFEQKGVKEGALAFARAALGVVEAAYGPDQQQENQQQQAYLWSSIFNMAFDLGLVEDAYTAALSNPQHNTAEDKVRRLVLALVEQGQLQQLISLPWAGVLQLKRDKLLEPVPVVEIVIDRLVSSACFSQQRGLSLQPLSGYQVLYDFLLAWGNYKHAAAAMLSYARRLRSMAAAAAAGSSASDKQQLQEMVTEVQAAYDTSISLLQLVDPLDAWIDPTQRLLQQYQAPLPAAASSSRPAAAASADETGSPFMPSRRQQQAAERSRQQYSTEQVQQQALQRQQLPPWQQQQQDLPAVLSLQDLQREAAMFAAAAAVHFKGAGLEVQALMGHSLDVGWLYDQLVGQGLFPEALQLAHAVYSGQQLLQQLEVAVAELAGQCADMQHGSQQQLGADGSSAQQREGFAESSMFDGTDKGIGVLHSSLLTHVGPSYLHSEAGTAWSKLRRLLERYDSFDCLCPGPPDGTSAGQQGSKEAGRASGSGSTDSRGISVAGARLRLAAVDGVLAAQPRMALPLWLLQPFQPTSDAAGMAGNAADPAALLQKYMEHWRLVDAARLVLTYLEAWQQRSSLQRVHSAAVWLPLQDMQLLHASLQDGARRARDKGAAAEADVLGSCAESLQDKLKQHIDLVKSDWGQLQLAAR